MSRPALVCLHGFMDTWHTWELVVPTLERRHRVVTPALVGHAGGPRAALPITDQTVPDAVERALDDAGIELAHLVGNSLGGFAALQLAARGRALSVVALAPAGGWAADDTSRQDIFAYQDGLQRAGLVNAPQAAAFLEYSRSAEWNLDAERITCPVRIVWGTEDALLPLPEAAHRYQHDWLPHADWIELDGIGHYPQQEVPVETAALILGFTAR